MIAFTDILTPTEVKEDSLDSLGGVDFTAPAISSAVERAIADVTDMVEQRLARKVVVREYTERITNAEKIDQRHVFNAISQYKYKYYPKAWPVVQVLTAGGSIEEDYIVFTTLPEQVNYFAGYRRSDQTLAKIQGEGAGEGGLDTLTELPGLIPGLIRRVAFRVLMIEIDQAVKNTYNLSTKTIVTGGVNTNITKTRDDIIEEELNKLSPIARI